METKQCKRRLRARIRAVHKAMTELADAAGDDIESLGEIIELDAEWIKWIKETIEPRFYDS